MSPDESKESGEDQAPDTPEDSSSSPADSDTPMGQDDLDALIADIESAAEADIAALDVVGGGNDEPSDAAEGLDEAPGESSGEAPSPLLTAEEFNQAMVVAADAAAKPLSDYSDLPPRAEIEWEPIRDPALREALLGPDYEAPSGDAGPLRQSELDEALAQQDDAPRPTEAQILSGERPEIEREEITDPALLEQLMGGAPEHKRDSALDQDALDALIASGVEQPEAVASGDPAPEEGAADSAPVDQAAIDALIAGDLESLAGGDPDSLLAGGDAEEALDAADMDQRLDEPAAVQDDAPVAQDDIDALIQSMSASAPAEAAPAPAAATAKAERDDGDEDPVVNENVAAGAAADDIVSQDLLDNLIGNAETAASPSPAAAPEEDSDLISQDMLDQLLSDAEREEEEAKLATEEAAARGDVEEEEVEPEPAVEAEEVPATPGAPGATVSFLYRYGGRLAASLTAALLTGVTTYGLLASHPLRPVPGMTELSQKEALDMERVLRTAREFVDAGSYADAIDVLDDAIAKTPMSPLKSDAEYLRLEAQYKAMSPTPTPGQADAMYGRIDRVIELAAAHPRAAEALLWKAKIYERDHNDLAARSVYRELLDRYDGADVIDQVLYSLAKSEMGANQAIEASDHAQEMLRRFPGSPLAPSARLLVGDAYAAIGDSESARIIYIQVAQEYPGDRLGAEAFERLGRMAFDAGNYKQAARELETRLQTSTTIEGNDGVYLLLAKTYRAEGRLEEARAMLNELIEFFPETDVTPEAYIELSQILDALGNRQEAVRLATQTVQRYPSNPEVLKNVGELLAASGDARSAGRALLAAQEAGADDPGLLLAAGDLFRRAGALDEARDAFERLVNVFPNSRQAFDGSIRLAQVDYDRGQIGKALERLEEMALATRGEPQRLPILTALGDLYRDLGIDTAVQDVYGQVAALSSEPQMLARSATALLEAGALDEGLAVAKRIDLVNVPEKTGYELLNAEGEALMRVDPRLGLDTLEEAYERFPRERTPEGDQRLLEANLTLDRPARARAIVAELQGLVARKEVEGPRLDQAALTWADYLFERRDYRAAADAYSIALGDATQPPEDPTAAPPALTAPQQWAAFQRATALANLGDFSGSLALYDRLAKGTSRWATESKARAAQARLEMRLRGTPAPAAQATD